MSDLFCCVACGTQGEAQCNCGKGYGYMPANEAATLGIAAHPDWSDRRIAEAVGVNHKTVAAARKPTGENSPVEKRTGKDGKKRKPRKPQPKQDKIEDAVEALMRAGKPVSRDKIAEEYDVGVHTVQIVVAKVEGKLAGEADPEITPDMLSKSAQEKLASAMRQYQKKLDASFAKRVQDDIKRLVEIMVLPAFKEEREDHALMVKFRKGAFKKTEYNVILRCVHPDRTPSIEEKNEAFQLLHERRLVLLSDKDDPRTYPKIPTADEILRGRK
jgi:hypothetical protein